MNDKSVVIIGGGLGGLFTGAILSKEGLKVTVLEKNAIIGGGLQSFSRFGEVYDTGMHIIGGMQEDGNIRRICEYLGIWDRIHVVDVDPECIDSIYFAEDRTTYRIAQGRKKFIESLAESFPDQKENLESYMEALYRVAGEVDLFYLKTSTDFMQVHSEDFIMSADAFIAKYISDEHLRSVVAYLNPLYGGRADFTPAYIHALISVLYIDGPSRFAGGSVQYAKTLKEFIEENGGEVLAGDAVVSVQSENRTITGVTTSSGSHFSGDYYVCAIHPCTFLKLLEDPAILPKIYRNRLDAIPNAYSAFTLNIKLKPGTFRYINHTRYYMSRYDVIWNFGDTDHWPCGFLFLTPPEMNQGEYSTKMIVTAPMQWRFVEKWVDTVVGQRGQEYLDWKTQCTEKLLDCIEELYPGFRDKVESINSASPLTIRDFYGVKEGSMYGFSKNCNNLLFSQVPVVTKVPNLFLTGQNCNLHGFCGVSLTAINTCEAILGQNYILGRINRFDDIRPYYNSEIRAAMQRITSHPYFPKVAGFVFPGQDVEELKDRISGLESHDSFQREAMLPAIKQIADSTCTELTCDGFENIVKDHPYLFVSNHRDIMMDASFLSAVLMENGHRTPEITFGANLMEGDFVIDIGKSNKMFKVERPGGDMREFYKSSEHLSDYIRNTIVRKRRSVWIAQRNGRTKDGVDRTDQGLIRMFEMSRGPVDRVKAIADLNIVPIAISYEWEPCDLLKAVELYRRRSGPYEKSPGEDLNSIIKGALQFKGKVHIHFCPVITEDMLRPFGKGTDSSLCRKVADLIDRNICLSYHLSPNNYIAKDIMSGEDAYKAFYSEGQRSEFERHLAKVEDRPDRKEAEELRRIILGIYASPVDSMNHFSDR